MTGKPLTIRKQILNLVKNKARDGIYQRDLQEKLKISKSYCSEQLTYLSRDTHEIAKRKEGGLTKIYDIEYYPGIQEGIVRIGMLKSSEYIPSIAAFNRVFNPERYRIIARFYDSTRQLIQDFNIGTLEIMLAPTKAIVNSGIMEENLKVISGLASGGSGVISHNKGRQAILSTEMSSMISLASDSAPHDLPKDIESYENPKSAVSDYISGKCNMIAIWEPYFTYLLMKPGNSVALEYKDTMNDFPCCCAAVSDRFYEGAKTEIEHWRMEYSKMEDYKGKDSPELFNAVKLISETTGIGKSVVENSLKNYNFHSTVVSLNLLKKIGIGLSERQKKSIFLPGVLME